MGRWRKLFSLDQLSAPSSICVPRGRVVPALGVFLATSLLLFYLLGPLLGGDAAASTGRDWGGVSSLFSNLGGYSGLIWGAGNATVGVGQRPNGTAEAHRIGEKGGVLSGNSTVEEGKGGGLQSAAAPKAANGTEAGSGGQGKERPLFARGNAAGDSQGNGTSLGTLPNVSNNTGSARPEVKVLSRSSGRGKNAAAPTPAAHASAAASARGQETAPASSIPGNATFPAKGGQEIAPASLIPGNATSPATGEGSDSRKREGPVTVHSSSKNKKCDIFDGRWVRDEAGPYYPPGSCPYVDIDFNCYKNGRPDNDYLKWRWQPHGCNLPRLNATNFLELLRGKRLIFVGDSLNRNMWESLVCILRHTVADKKRVYEKSGRSQFKTKGYYSFKFKDYSCSIDFVRSTFLVREVFGKGAHGAEGERLRLDMMDDTTSAYRDADIVVFNTGHWWTHEKTSEGKDYYQEGSHVYPVLNVMDAFKKALATWARWVDKNINMKKTRIFFRGYSLTHFSGGQWNSGGQCHKETEPIFNETFLVKYPTKMRAFEGILAEMKTPVTYLNISRLTDYRKDGHPSIYRKSYRNAADLRAAEATQDCSHWCLPGIPDAWNELLYASLVMDDKTSLQN